MNKKYLVVRYEKDTNNQWWSLKFHCSRRARKINRERERVSESKTIHVVNTCLHKRDMFTAGTIIEDVQIRRDQCLPILTPIDQFVTIIWVLLFMCPFFEGDLKYTKGFYAGSSSNVCVGLLKIHMKMSVIFSSDLYVRFVVRLRFSCDIERGSERKIF